jgi:hypothetical protein
MRTLVLLSFLCLLPVALSAQDAPPVRTFEPHAPAPATPQGPGNVTYQVDPAVQRTMDRFVEVKHELKGYRVQIFLGDRRTAEDTKRSFLLKYPDTPAYLSWLAPNFRLRVGDLRTRLEAEHLLHELKVLYPGSYIVPDAIEPPRMP